MWRKFLTTLTGDGRVARALANISGALAVAAAASTVFYGISDWLTPAILQLILASLSVLLSIGTSAYIYARLYRKLTNRYFTVSGSRISYRGRLKYAIRLSHIDGSYFTSLVWIKVSRVLILSMIGLFLFSIYMTDPHYHLSYFTLLKLKIYTHALLDSFALLALLTLVCAILMNLHEIHVISRGVSRLRIAAYYRRRKRR